MTIYLDHQATTPVSQAAVRAMSAHLSEYTGNPHSADHSVGWAAAEALDRARAAVAGALGAEPDEIVFTSGATEANNLALLGVAGTRPHRRRTVVSSIEHGSVMATARHLAARGEEVVLVRCGADGVVDPEEVATVLDGGTRLVSLMLVNNEIGTVQPVREIAERCAQAGVWLHVDAVQALSWMPLDVLALGCSSLCVSAHKVGGPPGIGALWVDPVSRNAIGPITHGGEQEGGLRPGTTPAFLAAGFAAAVAQLPGAAEVEEWRGRTASLLGDLLEVEPGLVLNGAASPRHPGNLNVRIPDLEASRVIALMQPHVAVSQGSACASGLPEPSHVLRALGLTAEEAGRSLRISTAASTTAEELARFVGLFATALERARGG